MNLEAIEAQGQRLLAALNEAHNRRQAWPAKHQEVVQVLTKVANLPSLKPHVMTVRSGGGLATLDFGKQLSGVPGSGPNKDGGALTFSQMTTGMVWAIIRTPSIDGVREAVAPNLIAEFLPNQLTEEAVLETVSKFLDVVISWELGEESE